MQLNTKIQKKNFNHNVKTSLVFLNVRSVVDHIQSFTKLFTHRNLRHHLGLEMRYKPQLKNKMA